MQDHGGHPSYVHDIELGGELVHLGHFEKVFALIAGGIVRYQWQQGSVTVDAV